jgi:uncharacterized protein YkwD
VMMLSSPLVWAVDECGPQGEECGQPVSGVKGSSLLQVKTSATTEQQDGVDENEEDPIVDGVIGMACTEEDCGELPMQMAEAGDSLPEEQSMLEQSVEDVPVQMAEAGDSLLEEMSMLEQSGVASQEWALFKLVNKLRAKGFRCPDGTNFRPNRKPLVLDCRLSLASRKHSQDMARKRYFSHNSLNGRTPWARATAARTVSNGENIAAGNGPAGTLMQWKKSNGHCLNMGNPKFKVMGIGYSSGGKYGHLWTQNFANAPSYKPLDQKCKP